MAVERKLMTAEELLLLGGGEGKRYELLDGVLHTMPAAGGPHGLLGGRLMGRLTRHIDDDMLGEYFLAETGFIFRRNPDRVRAPDFAFVRADRMPPEGLPRGFVPFPPDMLLEVVSPDDSARYIREKVDDWLGFGVRAIWVLFAAPRLDVYALDGTVRTFGPDDEVDGGEVLPGFRLLLRDLVRPPTR